MANIDQKLQTNVVVEAKNALDNIGLISEALAKVSKIDFSNMAKAFGDMNNALKATANTASKTSAKMIEEEKKIQNLLQKRKAVMKEMMDKYSKDPTFTKTSDFDRLKSQFESLNMGIGNFMTKAGRSREAVKYLKDALYSVANTPFADNLVKQIAKLENSIANVDQKIKNTKQELNGNVPVSKEQKQKADEIAKQNRKANDEYLKQQEAIEKKKLADEKKRLDELTKLSQKAINLIQSINNHKGADGLIYTDSSYRRELARMRNLLAEFKKVTDAKSYGLIENTLNNSLFDGANFKSSKSPVKNTEEYKNLSKQLSEARTKAGELAAVFEKTRTIADGIRFQSALSDLKKLEAEADKMDKSLTTKAQGAMNYIENHLQWAGGAWIGSQLWNLPSDLVESYRQLEQAMAGVAQVMPLIEGNQAETNKEAERFINIAHEYARATDEVAEAGQLWGRGYGKPQNINTVKEEAQKAGIEELTDAEAKYIAQSQAMKTTNELVAQSALLATVDNFSMAESVKGLEAILSAYNMRAKSAGEATLFAGRAVDSITKVAHYGQISAQDLVQGIEATGKAAEQAGISLEFLEAMIETGSRNTGLAGRDIGNAVKALTVGIYSSKGTKELKNFGIDTTEIKNGVTTLRSAQSIILDIMSAIKTGKKDARDMLLAVSGGRYQYSKISSILKDESEVLRMWGEAVNSNGFAKEQLKVQMETLNAHIKQLKANLTSLIQEIMNDGAGDGIKKIIDALSFSTKALAEHMGGVKTAVTALIAGFAIAKAVRFTAEIARMAKTFKSFQAELKAAGDKNTSAGSLLKDGAKELYNRGKSRLLGEETSETNKLTEAVNKHKLAVEAESLAKKKGIPVSEAKVILARTETVAQNGLKTATEAATATELRQAAVSTIATAGLNVLIGLVVTGFTAWMMYDTAMGKAEDTYAKISGYTQKAIQDKEDEIASLQQEISVRRESADYMDKAIDVYARLKQSTEEIVASKGKEAEADATWQKNKAQMIEIETNFSDILGADAMKRIKESSDVKKAYTEEKNNYVKCTDEKVKTLAQLQREARKYWVDKANYFSNQKDIYIEDLRNFGHWCEGQIHGLGVLEEAWAKYQERMYNSSKKDADYYNNKINEVGYKKYEAQKQGKSTFMYDVQLDEYRARKQEAEDYMAEHEKKAKSGLEIFGMKVIEGLDDKVSKMSSNATEAVGKASDYTIDPNSITGINGADSDLEYSPTPKTKKGKTGKGAHHKTLVDFSSVADQVYHNMALDGTLTGMGFDESTIKAVSQAINGEDTSDLFGIGESDPMWAGFHFAEKMKQYGGLSGLCKNVLGDDKYEGIMAQAKKFKDDLDWSRAGNEVFGQSNTPSPSMGQFDSNIDEYMDRTLSLGREACVEAVGLLGQSWSQFLTDEYNGNVRGVDRLIADAKSAGISIIAFDESQLDSGDVVVYDNASEKLNPYDPTVTDDNHTNHVLLHYGEGVYGEHTMVGNASSANGGVGGVKWQELYQGQTPSWIIKTGKQTSGGIPWVNSKEKPTPYNWTYDPVREQALKEEQINKQLEQQYQLEVQRAEVEKQLHGETSAYFKAVSDLENQRLENMKRHNENFANYYDAQKNKFNEFIKNSDAIQTALKNNGIRDFFSLSDVNQKELMTRLNNTGSDLDKNMFKLYEWLEKNENTKEKNSVEQAKQQAKVDRLNGAMTPEEKLNYAIQRENNRYELTKDPAFDSPSANNKHWETIINLYKAEQVRLDAQVAELQTKDNLEKFRLQNELTEYARLINETQNQIDQLLSDKNPSDERKVEIGKLTEKVKDLKEQATEAEKKLNNLHNGSEKTREAILKSEANKKAMVEAQRQADTLKNQLKSTIVSGTTQMFSDMLLEGKSFEEGWQSLWKSIAQMAIQQLVKVLIFERLLKGVFGGIGGIGGNANGGTPNVGSGSVGGGYVLAGLTGNAPATFFRNGGKVPAYANGGYTDGLIEGAGTGTSDSILTYLAHRGQFIRTSNGEYIIQKKAVNKLGVPFLDMLNNNPEAVKSMKKYADGGSLGSEYVPTVSENTLSNYKNFTKTNNSNKKAILSTKKMEELQGKTIEAINNREQDGNGSLVVLNTQASSDAVLQALAKNPRAVQAILGGQNRRGFR